MREDVGAATAPNRNKSGDRKALFTISGKETALEPKASGMDFMFKHEIESDIPFDPDSPPPLVLLRELVKIQRLHQSLLS